jgi:DNA-binding MarR family transcriptional regulator
MSMHGETVRTKARRSPEPESRPYRLDDQVGFVLRKVSQRHTSLFAARIGEDVTPMQWAVLAKLAEKGALSQNLLGRETAMDAATVKGVVDRLTKRGLLEVAPDPNDQRLLNVSLTHAGRQLAGELTPRAQSITDETLAPLTIAERRSFLALLSKLC